MKIDLLDRKDKALENIVKMAADHKQEKVMMAEEVDEAIGLDGNLDNDDDESMDDDCV